MVSRVLTDSLQASMRFSLFLLLCAPAAAEPVLGYAGLFGNKSDAVAAMAVDAAGNIYITGTTTQSIPLVNPINPTLGGGNCSSGFPTDAPWPCEDVFVAKFDPTGTKLLYSTYLGGNQRDFAAGIAVDRQGNAYVAGTTRAVSPFYATPRDGQAFVTKVNSSGSAILYTRYVNGDTAASAIAVDAQGNAYLGGTSLAPDFPAVHAFQASAPTQADSTGNVYVAGRTNSFDFPVANAIQAARAGGFDAFAAKLSTDGASLVYSTYLGGSLDDHANGIAVDGVGNAYLAGGTVSTDFPTVSALQPSTADRGGSFVAAIDPSGKKLLYSTYLNGSDYSVSTVLAVDPAGGA